MNKKHLQLKALESLIQETEEIIDEIQVNSPSREHHVLKLEEYKVEYLERTGEKYEERNK